MEKYIQNITDIIRKVTADKSYSENNAIEDVLQAHLNELGKKTFKVKFSYQKDTIGRRVEFDDIHIFDVYNSVELHNKINNYIDEKSKNLVNKWHYGKVISIDEI